MFYCERCAKKNEWPYAFYLSRSFGPCEICGQPAICADVPSKNLPDAKRKKDKKKRKKK